MTLSRSIAPSHSCVNSGFITRLTVKLVLPAFLAILAGAALYAQAGNPVTQEAKNARVRTLANHHPLWANAAHDAGPLPPDKMLDQLTVVLSRSTEQQSAFESFLADQQNPASPEYHHWLTPSEVGDRFGLSPQQIASVTAWLKSQGLHINWISPSRIFIGFGGTAQDVGRALQTELHYYTVNGVRRVSVSSDPVIPEALAPALKAIRGLYTIEEHPLHHAKLMNLDSPLMNAGGGTHYVVPADFATIYDLPSDWSGIGQTIGIVGRSRTDFNDFENFRNLTQSSLPNPTEIVPTAFGGEDPGPADTSDIDDQGEATLDVMRAGSVAPGANLLLIVDTATSGDVYVDAQYLVQTSPTPAQVMTISFGLCESEAGPTEVSSWDALFSQAAAEGISSFVSSGDSGASGCDLGFQTPPASPEPNSPNSICSSSYVTCVGGTEFNDAGNSTAYWSPTNGGNLGSALSYIPEGGWNEPLDDSSNPQPASSGGGVSLYIDTPSWQTGTGVPAARTGRYTPDISFTASEHDAYFGCLAVAGANCFSVSESLGFAGTSASAPSMAGIAALLNQATGEPQGNLNPELYKLAASTPAAFHDVTVASSGVSNCSVDTPSMCNNSVPSASGLNGGQAGYLVTAGYDEVTGLGSLDVANFFTSYVPKLVPTVTATPSATSITILQQMSVSVTVDGGAGNPMPTGSVTLTSGNYTSAAVTLNDGAATFNIPARALPTGANDLLVKYSPDQTSSTVYSAASGDCNVQVTLLNPTVTATPTQSTLTTAQTLSVAVTVSSGAGNPIPTGVLTLNGSGFNATLTANLAGGSATFSVYPGLLSPGSDTLVATYTPDSSGSSTYNSASNSVNVNVSSTAPFTPAVTVTPSFSGDIARAVSLPVAISVSGGSGKPMPTGSLVLLSGAYLSASTPLVNGVATITIPPESLSVGNDPLTAVYAPDAASASSYNNTSGSCAVIITDPVKSVPGITITPSPTTISPTQSLSVMIAVAGNNGYPTTTGSVTLSSGGFTSASTPLSSNSATIGIPAGTLPTGVDILTVAYTPDAQSTPVFYSASSAATVTVGVPGFAVTGTSVFIAPGASSGNTSNITVTPFLGFSGSVTLSGAVSASPAGAQNLPTLSFGSANPVTTANGQPSVGILTIATTAPSKAAASDQPKHPGVPWYAAAGTALAGILLFGVPAKRRRWRTMLGTAALLVALAGGVLSCGGGAAPAASGGTGSGNTGGGSTGGSTAGGGSNSGTTLGAYTITVTGTSGATTATGTVMVYVE